MKILLIAINAKYTHMNPAVYSIRAYAGPLGEHMDIAEYTINLSLQEVLRDIERRNPEVIGISCYIWNINFIGELLKALEKASGSRQIFLGGPEVSYNPREVLERFPMVDGVFCKEGEVSWKMAAAQLVNRGKISGEIPGLMLQGTDDVKKRENYAAEPVDMDDIPFIYDNLSIFRNRMLYYETSRGCPFRCSYCLSSIEKGMRFRSLKLVLPELKHFLDGRVRIVKFVDRTFNADRERAMKIWRYLAENDNKVTTFHFEVEGSLLTDEEIDFLQKVRKGLFQLEIGVQTVNPKTLSEICRNTKTEKIKNAVTRLTAAGNIHIHLDLIAGLPFEDFESFRHSFNEVYSWGGDMLQLGFLKILHGTVMEKKAADYKMKRDTSAPYEVKSTAWISGDEMEILHGIEEQLNRYGNSGAYKYTMPAVQRLSDGPFDMYETIDAYYKSNPERFDRESRISAYEMLREVIGARLAALNESRAGNSEKNNGENRKKRSAKISGEYGNQAAEMKHFDALLLIDLYKKEKLKARPDFFGGGVEQKRRQREMRRNGSLKRGGPKESVHVEFFDFDVELFMRTGQISAADCRVFFLYEDQGPAKEIGIKKENL
ncbi:MAG: DUF4080 domain-containing protein [Lachnospiraceae bacterium]|jgi:radical SAM superfamily enzyme YgiQ (UPF0313 family)